MHVCAFMEFVRCAGFQSVWSFRLVDQETLRFQTGGVAKIVVSDILVVRWHGP